MNVGGIVRPAPRQGKIVVEGETSGLKTAPTNRACLILLTKQFLNIADLDGADSAAALCPRIVLFCQHSQWIGLATRFAVEPNAFAVFAIIVALVFVNLSGVLGSPVADCSYSFASVILIEIPGVFLAALQANA